MKILFKTVLTILMLLSVFSSAQGFEKYLGETIADVKKLLDQDKIEYVEKIDSKELPFLTFKVESVYVRIPIVIIFKKDNKNDVVSNRIFIRMPFNTDTDKDLIVSFLEVLQQNGYEDISEIKKYIISNVLKSENNGKHQKEHYLCYYKMNDNKSGHSEKDDYYFYVSYELDLNNFTK